MNVDRRATGHVCIALLREFMDSGEMDERSHVALVDAIHTMQNGEYWQLKNQSRHEGKNATTDKQLAISRVALPALESAVRAIAMDDYSEVLAQLVLAVEADGQVTPSRGTRRK